MHRLGRRLALLCIGLAACGGASDDTAPSPAAALAALPPVGVIAEPPTTTTPTPPTTTSTTVQPKRPVTLGFAGDTSFTHGLDGRDPLGGVAELLTAPDYTAVNLETTVGEPGVGTALDKTYIFRSPPRSIELLTAAGVDAVSLANNHTLDYRREGLLRTIELLDEGGLGYFGAGPDASAAYAAHVATVGDWRIAFIGFTHIECGWVADDLTRWPESAWACPGFEDRTVQAVATADVGVDYTVVMVHWGIEKDHCPQSYQHELARRWVDAGADLIIGSHPHVLQGLERIDEVWVVHSTGNFAFPSARGVSARSAYFTATIDEHATALRVTPLTIVDGRPRPMGAEAAAAMAADLSSWSFGWEVDASGEIRAASDVGSCG